MEIKDIASITKGAIPPVAPIWDNRPQQLPVAPRSFTGRVAGRPG